MNARDAVLIVGGGLAGLFLALKLAPRRAIVLCQAPLGAGASSAWAQGGLAAALAPEDNPALHAQDTIAAGAGLVDPVIARLIAEEGPARVMDLIALGVPFDRTQRRQTGAKPGSRPFAPARRARVRRSRRQGDHGCADRRRARRAAYRNHRKCAGGGAAAGRQRRSLRGAGRTRAGGNAAEGRRDRARHRRRRRPLSRSPPIRPSAVGHGLAMAARLGALIADPEFVQFHPTAIDVGRDPAPLASEALRGEGAHIVNGEGASIRRRICAARDVVARAIHLERAHGTRRLPRCARSHRRAFPKCISHRVRRLHGGGARSAHRASSRSRRRRIITWAASSPMSGGRTSCRGLSAVGECASTGAHGANRLASNSLLEAVVFAHRVADRLRDAETVQALRAAPASAPADAGAGGTSTIAPAHADPRRRRARRRGLNHRARPHRRALRRRRRSLRRWLRRASSFPPRSPAPKAAAPISGATIPMPATRSGLSSPEKGAFAAAAA